MALTSVPPVKLELPSIPVQELIKSNTNQIPQRYLVSDSTLDSNRCVLPWMDRIIIDFQLLLDVSSPCAKEELLKLRDALSSWGCFQMFSNGILKSSVHRAVIDKEKERMSVAVLNSVAIDKEIGPLSELFDKDRPKLYKNIDNFINAMKIQQ